MKKILLLLLAAWKLSAGFIDDLEKAIMKSDLSAVQELSRSNISISDDEKIALINSQQTYYRKFLDKNKELQAVRTNAITCCLAAALSFVLAPAGVASQDGLLCIVALAIPCLSGVAAFYNGIKYINLREKLIKEHDTACKIRYDNAIQIRQLLYKIQSARMN